MITPEWIVCANAGDSRAIYAKKPREVVPLSMDHKLENRDEEQRIRAARGAVYYGRVEDLSASHGFGDFRYKDLPTAIDQLNLTSDCPTSSLSSSTMQPGA